MFKPLYPSYPVKKDNLNMCTYNQTGSSYEEQYWKSCFDCFKNSNEGACLNCIHICHDRHNIGPIRYGKFFCDCGANDHKCKTYSIPKAPRLPPGIAPFPKSPDQKHYVIPRSQRIMMNNLQ